MKSQIAFAIILTACAIILLPTALSAKHDAVAQPAALSATGSAGTIAVTMHNFNTADLDSSAFSDWD